MKTTDIIRRAGRNLKQAKVRTLLTALAISVGAFTITLALAAGTGGQAYTTSLINNNGDARSLMVFAKVADQTNSDGPREYGTKDAPSQAGILNSKDVAAIEKISGVETVIPMYSVSATYVTGPSHKKYETDVTIKVDETAPSLAAGSLEHNQLRAGEVMISESFVGPLGFKNAKDAIGKTITLRIDKPAAEGAKPVGKDMTFKIAAVDKKSETILHYQEGIQVSPSDGEAIYNYQTPGTNDQYYGVTARVADGVDPQSVQQTINDKGYEVFSLQDMQEALFTFVNIVMGGAAGFGALAILASIFGIINTQYISVLERTQQIGLMKALGARRRDIGRLFRYEAAWVGFLGGLIGVVGARLVGLLNPLITQQLNLEKGTELLIFNPLHSLALVVSLTFIAVLAGWFPSRKAAKLDPITALRTE